MPERRLEKSQDFMQRTSQSFKRSGGGNDSGKGVESADMNT